MRRGMNLGGAMGERELDIVREAGFDTVRLPVDWSRTGCEQVDHAIDQALARDLDVVVDVHDFGGGADALLEHWDLQTDFAAHDKAWHEPLRAALLGQAVNARRAGGTKGRCGPASFAGPQRTAPGNDNVDRKVDGGPTS